MISYDRKDENMFDSILIANITNKLNNELIGKRIDKIYQPDESELLFLFQGREKLKLLVNVNPDNPYISLVSFKRDNPVRPFNFNIMLRKYLSGAIITEIIQQDFDRVISLTLKGRNEFLEEETYILHFEMMGRYSNVILTDSSGRIMESIKRVSPSMSQKRPVYPGLWYEKIENNRLNPLIQGSEFDGDLTKYQGFSRKLIKYFSVLLSDDKNLHDVLSKLINGNKAYVFYDEHGNLYDYHLFPIEGYESREFESIFEMLEYYHSNLSTLQGIKGRAQELKRLVDGRISRAMTKRKKLNSELQDAMEADQYKIIGELIQANLYNLGKFDKRITLFNYYDNNDIEIDMDTRLTAVENSNKYFKKYNKLKRARIMLDEQLAETEKEIEFLESITVAIDNATSTADISEIRDELATEGIIKRRTRGKSNDKPSAPLKYKLGETQILVGKNNRQNDSLTFKTASKDDMWLHVKDMPGSHVIIRKNYEQVSDEELTAAATLAAYHSKGKGSSNVPVDYTRIRDVKKPSGAKPGFVNYFKQRTIYVTPNEKTILELKK